MISYLTDPKVLEKILTHLGLPTCAPAIAPARSLDADAPELDFEDPTDPPVRPWPTAARSPPEPKGQVDVDAPTDDDGGFWGACAGRTRLCAGHFYPRVRPLPGLRCPSRPNSSSRACP